MFASTVLFAALASMAIAAPVNQDLSARASKAPPAGWAYGYLENYATYHARYLALDCQDKHNTDFFEQCCHPLLATQTLHADRPSQCWPSAEEISSANAEVATATGTAAADGDAASQFADATSTVSAALASATQNVVAQPITSAAAASPSPAAPASSPSPSPQSNNNGGGSGGNWNTGGYATFFYQNGNPGACGNYNSDSTPLVAIDQAWWPNFGQVSPYCGQMVEIVNTQNGKSVQAMIQDVCPTCANGNSLDLSTGAFDQIADESQGQVPIEWKFL